jgi:hypothetical protein
MTVGRSLRCLLGIGILVLLVMPGTAQAQTCFFVGTPPDGRVLGPYGLNSASDDISLAFTTEAGRSYVVDARTQRGPSGSGSASVSFNVNTFFCPTTDVASGFTFRDTINITPTCNASCSGGFARSIVSGTNASFLEFRIHNGSVSTSSVVVSVTETTLFSTAWSTNGTFDTFYSLQNTTNSTCNVTLTLLDTTGAVRTTFSTPVISGATFSTNTSALGTARNVTGTARATQDCPPDAIQAEAAIANFNIAPTPYFQFVKFTQGHALR